jgi:hypothetical protein
MHRSLRSVAAATALLAAAVVVHAADTIGTAFPAGFPAIEDASLTGRTLLGFGAAGKVVRTPVVFIHGNNDTPYPTQCNPFGRVHAFAQFFAAHGYSASELWAIGYEGDQCDLPGDQTRRSSIAHTNAANVPDLRRFVRAVLAYTKASEIDIVAHSLGVTIAREWMRQDEAGRVVRRLVAIDGPNHGIINCSPSPQNYFQLPAAGGFTPASEVCQELGSPRTPFLRLLNDGDQRRESRAGKTLVIRNADVSFVYFPIQDGAIAPVPAIDSFGIPTDFSHSASIKGAREISLTGQGAYDPVLGTAHLGILNSPTTWQATLEFLTEKGERDKDD